MSEQFREEQDTIRAKVIKVCNEHPEAKHDYRTLLQYYWFYEDELRQFVPMDVLKRLTQPESICRAFRKAVEEGSVDLQNSERIAREKRQQQYREYYNHKLTRWVREPI